MNTSDVLNKAADLIEERGWTKGVHGWDDRGGDALCLEGGIAVAAGLSLTRIVGCPAASAVIDYLGAENCTFHSALSDTTQVRPWVWNDAPNRTAAEVIEVLRAAALIESAKESADERVAVTVR